MSESTHSGISEPLHGFIPHRVTENQVRKALDHELNPFTRELYTPQYKELLEIRKKLPIFAQMDKFLEMYNKNKVIIVLGETGTGKTTLPQFVAFSDMPHTKGKMVAFTQPRRATARAPAKRVADEMDVKLGRHVGYSVRFENVTEPGTTFLTYVTDGLLLREVVSDKNLDRYSTIILDEAHERTLAIDILMALLKDIIKRRSDLRVIVMSATLDAHKFQDYLSRGSRSTAPLFKFTGRTHPVEVFYTREPEKDYVEAAVVTVLMIHLAEEPGDILLFLTGEEEIEDTCRRIELAATNPPNNNSVYLIPRLNQQMVQLHPSCGLKARPEWVIFNEFILTSHPYLRTVTGVRVEWLLDDAPLYFDPTTFPKGGVRMALQRALAKRRGLGSSAPGRSSGTVGELKSLTAEVKSSLGVAGCDDDFGPHTSSQDIRR